MIYKEESYKIIGAAIEVHNTLGYGFTEPIYQAALEEEFRLRGIEYEREKEFPLHYKEKLLDKKLRVDFVCYNKIIVELKAVSDFVDEHYAQIYNYLKAIGMQLGILVNFGKAKMQFERIPCQRKWLQAAAKQAAFDSLARN